MYSSFIRDGENERIAELAAVWEYIRMREHLHSLNSAIVYLRDTLHREGVSGLWICLLISNENEAVLPHRSRRRALKFIVSQHQHAGVHKTI